MPRNITLEDIGRLYKDTIVQHNDNTRVLNVPHRVYNQALQRRFQNGAKQNAAWDKDHPVAAKWRNVATAAPFAVAAAPFATTALGTGRAIISIPRVAKTLATVAKSPVGKIASKAKPYVNGILSLTGLGAGVNETINNGFTPQAALDIGGAISLGANATKSIWGFVQKPNSFTRGIGDKNGLNDLIQSGLIRGNPYGTAVTAKLMGKYLRFNRGHFNDIIEATGNPNIAYKYYRNQLNEKEFYNLKNAELKVRKKYKLDKNDIYNNTPSPLVADYDNYADYVKYQQKYRPTSTAYDGTPLAYYYDDGRNPIMKGHDYAKSIYGVRINNASSYNPRIFTGHLHYSMPKAIRLDDPNVEVFKRGPFGITLKMNKRKLINQHNKYNGN